MSSIYQSRACCALYELANIDGDEPTKAAVENHIDTMKAMAQPIGTLPLICFFSSASTGNTKGSEWGDKWAKLLRDMGYRVDQIQLGKNPKSQRYVVLYHWYVHKGTLAKKESTKEVILIARPKRQKATPEVEDRKPRGTTRTVRSRSSLSGGVKRRVRGMFDIY